MSKSFRELREQSIHLPKKGRESRHSRSHRLEPHISHALTTSPTGEFDRPKKLNELLGALAVGAVAGAVAHRAVTRPGGVVDRVQRERKRKEQLKAAIKASEERTKALKDRLRKASVVKAAFNMQEDAPAVSVASGSVAPIAPPNPTDVYSLQKNRFKSKMLRRKKPV